MLSRNKKAINALNEDDIVLFKEDDVYLGSADAPNLFCVILEKKDDMFKLGHKESVLNQTIPYNVFQKIDGIGMDFSRADVPMDIKISVLEAVKCVTIDGDQ